MTEKRRKMETEVDVKILTGMLSFIVFKHFGGNYTIDKKEMTEFLTLHGDYNFTWMPDEDKNLTMFLELSGNVKKH